MGGTDEPVSACQQHEDRDPETFDDTEFYQTLLKEFLEGSADGASGNWYSVRSSQFPTAASQFWADRMHCAAATHLMGLDLHHHSWQLTLSFAHLPTCRAGPQAAQAGGPPRLQRAQAALPRARKAGQLHDSCRASGPRVCAKPAIGPVWQCQQCLSHCFFAAPSRVVFFICRCSVASVNKIWFP